MAKGPQWEREICKALSLWWTKDDPEPSDSVFWRTSQSGGRATSRGKKGKKTKGQYGDICATEPVGQPLIDAITFECKRGYSKFTLHDALDRSHGGKPSKYEEWVEKIDKTCAEAGTKSWAIIARRDRREALVIMPDEARFLFHLKRKDAAVILQQIHGADVFVYSLEWFLQAAERDSLCSY